MFNCNWKQTWVLSFSQKKKKAFTTLLFSLKSREQPLENGEENSLFTKTGNSCNSKPEIMKNSC